MPRLVEGPTTIEAAGNLGKVIEEFVGYRCRPKNSRVRSQARSAAALSYMDGA